MQKSIQQENELEINKALNIAFVQKGPVHLNIPFDEPLYDMVDDLSVKPPNMPPELKDDILEDVDRFKDIWKASKKKMILVGVNQPNSINQSIKDLLAQDESIVVFTETTSNLHHDNFFPSIDKVLVPLSKTELLELQPDILLTFGGMIVSKKIKAFLREYKPKEHWHIDPKKANDTFFCLGNHFKVDVNSFFNELNLQNLQIKSDYRNYWQNIMKRRRELHDSYLLQIPFSDFKVFDAVLNSIPNESIVHVGNSSAIRYTQLFDLNRTIKLFCNRGTSGIDGSTSTALGSSVVSEIPTIFITGDLSFFYDSNALWNNYIPKSFRIIVVNNGSGGIFRILSGHKNTSNFDTYFETKHSLTAQNLCDMYQFEYSIAKNKDQLMSQLDSFYTTSNKPKLLEVFTPRTVNDGVLLDYFEFIK